MALNFKSKVTIAGKEHPVEHVKSMIKKRAEGKR